MKYLLLAALFLVSFVSSSTGQDANHLQGAESPYLLQHLYNPVDWYPWGPEALQKAKSEDKLIFVSVGYSSCHWCHVMEEESFENESIAELLNANFVSIKIDRESRPDLDEQFMFVTQVLTGEGGWPNSVFLTPDGDPFFAGTYIPPDTFRSFVTQLHDAWQDDPVFIDSEARKVTLAVSGYLTQKAEAREVTPEIVNSAAASVLEDLDPFNGGYGVAPKFPRESLFLFLLDQAERTGDRQLLGAVADMLDGMIKGGIHDHVGGGFHRYAIDPEWHVPHFEKMLYTQAMTGRLLVRLWDITGEPRYRRAAERLFDYVLRELRDPGGGFYSAQDADSLTANDELAEGVFYTWSPSDFGALGSHASLARDVFQVTQDGDFEGANVLNLRSLPAALAAEHQIAPPAFSERLDRILLDMYALRSERSAPFLDRKVVVSWNAMMIETLAEAGYRLDRPDYYRAAAEAARFILDQMNSPAGLKRVFFGGSVRIPGQLADYAGLGLALVALHDYSPDRDLSVAWLWDSRAMADGIRSRFGNVDDGYHMTETMDGLSAIVPQNDTEIPSGNALALALFARLSHRSQVPAIEQDGFRLAAALSGNAVDIPDQRGFTLKAIQELQRGETGRLRFAANGAVKAELSYDRKSGQLIVAISVADGWHINAHEPLDDYFIATGLTSTEEPDLAVQYPDPITKTLSISSAPLALYEGDLRIEALLGTSAAKEKVRRAKLTLQACSNEICLQPEDLIFVLW